MDSRKPTSAPRAVAREQTHCAYTLRGNRVAIIDWSTDAYLVRFESGLTRWLPRGLLRPWAA